MSKEFKRQKENVRIDICGGTQELEQDFRCSDGPMLRKDILRGCGICYSDIGFEQPDLLQNSIPIIPLRIKYQELTKILGLSSSSSTITNLYVACA